MPKKARSQAKIGGVTINSTNKEWVLREIAGRISKKEKTVVVTPNPEFIVFAQHHLWFKKLVNSAHFVIPDGIGLVLAGKLLGQPIGQRIAGADLVKELLSLANQNQWSVGVAGARRGVEREKEILFRRLSEFYSRANFFDLDHQINLSGKQNRVYQLVFACQGMGRQEKWISENYLRVPGLLFMAIGGSLDFLTGFARRAPAWLRKSGLEWLWRGVQHPAHFKRILTAVVEFPWIVFKEKFNF